MRLKTLAQARHENSRLHKAFQRALVAHEDDLQHLHDLQHRYAEEHQQLRDLRDQVSFAALWGQGIVRGMVAHARTPLPA
jgi:hypothetical protein